MRIYEQQQLEILVAKQCNRCGAEVRPDDEDADLFFSIDITTDDGTTHELDLCHDCFLTLLGPYINGRNERQTL